MSDLHQYAALLGEHDDATIAGMAGCSGEDVAAFRASLAPTRRGARKVADKAPAAVEDAAPPPREAARLEPTSFPEPAPEAADLPRASVQETSPSAIRVRNPAGLDTVMPDGRRLVLSFRDVIPSTQAELVAYLWATHRDAFEAYPVRR